MVWLLNSPVGGGREISEELVEFPVNLITIGVITIINIASS
jgi:hypothetical protein